MDICSNTGKLASEDLKNFHELAVDPSPSQLTCGFTGDLPVNDLANDLSKILNLQDDKNLVSGSIPVCGNNGVGKVDISEDPHPLSMSTSEKFLSKSATFPGSNNVMSPTAAITCENEGKAGDGVDGTSSEVSVQNGCIKSDTAPCRSISLPMPLKLVSALKGSREKHGVPLKKLTVTWAPDVYDPTPTAVSHVVTNKSRHRNDSKRNTKNKQKGTVKTSRGSRGKDKKQGRKYGGSSNRCFKSLDVNERVVDQVQHQADIMDYNIGNPDPYCGTSFLKNSVSKLHFSVAEAT